MSKIEKILKYIDSVPNYTAKLKIESWEFLINIP